MKIMRFGMKFALMAVMALKKPTDRVLDQTFTDFTQLLTSTAYLIEC